MVLRYIVHIYSSHSCKALFHDVKNISITLQPASRVIPADLVFELLRADEDAALNLTS